MREIKFRGKRLEDNKMIYGNLITTSDGRRIIQPWLRTSGVGYTHPKDNTGEIDPETVGQYIGLKDRNGKEIYEGDLVKQVFNPNVICEIKLGEYAPNTLVDWNEAVEEIMGFQTMLGFYAVVKDSGNTGGLGQELFINKNMVVEVIGNIHEKEASHD